MAQKRSRNPAHNPAGAALGARIQDRRKHLGLTRLEVAQSLEVDPQSVYRWEKGTRQPSSETLVDLARLLRVTPAWLWKNVGAAE